MVAAGSSAAVAEDWHSSCSFRAGSLAELSVMFDAVGNHFGDGGRVIGGGGFGFGFDCGFGCAFGV